MAFGNQEVKPLQSWACLGYDVPILDHPVRVWHIYSRNVSSEELNCFNYLMQTPTPNLKQNQMNFSDADNENKSITPL